MRPALSQYRTVTRTLAAHKDGSLGDDDATLEYDAASLLDPALTLVVRSLDPAGLETHALPPAAMAAAATARALANQAIAETDIPSKMRIATAASYSAAFFGLPRNKLLATVDQVCGMFAMTASQRRAMHQDAARLLDRYVIQLQKGNAMSGAYRDGSLGLVRQNGAFQDGSLGILQQQGAFRDGTLGFPQSGAFRDGSLGATFMGDKAYAAWRRTHPGAPLVQGGFIKRKKAQLRGLGCGCSGVGADVAVVPDEPFYKKPVYIAGAAVALGVVLYAATRK